MIREQSFDYVVVGAGSAGCVLAGRLSQWARVLLLETGGPDAGIQNGVDIGRLVSDPGNIIRAAWDATIGRPLQTEPQRSLGGRRIVINRGVVRGGCHSVNGMIYVRGHRRDYDAWAQMGNEGWGYDDVLPFFKTSESFEPSPLTYSPDDLRYHGRGGPLSVRPVPKPTPFAMAFIDGAHELGYGGGTPHWDFNGHTMENGAGLFQVTVTPDGRRATTARAFLDGPAAGPGLTVTLRATVTRIVVEHRKAVGVEYVADGRRATARVDGEVVLCAGAFGSPHLLMLSGIGAAGALRPSGIPCLVDLPGVGQNLQDHPMVVLLYEAERETGQSTFTAEAGLFVDTRGGSTTASPDLQFHALGMMPRLPDVLARVDRALPPRYFSICPTVSKSTSRGSLVLRPGRPTAQPLIDPKYLRDESDWQTLARGMELTEELVRTRAIREFGPRYPAFAFSDGWRVPLPARSARRTFIASVLTTTWHPAGTCKMGRDPLAVVDPQLRVHGVDGLRVADASVMPELPSANINAACIMIGERCADLVRRASSGPPARAGKPAPPTPVASGEPPPPAALLAILEARRRLG
jgi:choline dehydrogenase